MLCKPGGIGTGVLNDDDDQTDDINPYTAPLKPTQLKAEKKKAGSHRPAKKPSKSLLSFAMDDDGDGDDYDSSEQPRFAVSVKSHRGVAKSSAAGSAMMTNPAA